LPPSVKFNRYINAPNEVLSTPPTWKNLQTIWTPPKSRDKMEELYLVRITDPEDLVTWGKYMGHSGGRYQKWIVDNPIWAFLTFIDPKGYPHVTIHLKQSAWFNRFHPDDAMAVTDWPWGFGPGPVDTNGKAQFWVKSTEYEGEDKTFGQDCDITLPDSDIRWVIMRTGHVDGDPLWLEEEDLVSDWFNTRPHYVVNQVAN
jgi:hypothetical protein